MSDTLMTIIGIFLAVILMFIFPLMEFAGKNDEIAQTSVQIAVSDFVNTVASQGKITLFDYNQLVQKLYATGNSYDIQIEAQILDDNPRRATTTGSSDLLGEYKYYSVYKNTILDKINNSKEQEYILKKDDYIVVTVKNTNITMGTELKNLFYKLIGKDTYTIGTSASTLVVNGGNDEIKHEGAMTENTPTHREKTILVNGTSKTSTSLKMPLIACDKTKDITLKIGTNTYKINIIEKNSSNFSNSVIYEEDGEYKFDLKILKELLNIAGQEWETISIAVDYTKL